ncbi:sensor histidine kinase [Bradyrhizobium sp. STM 3809]|uniref:sensor histidine kinase n=1 Tax=Bradyrhizobium sp. STM 3809 TaxID=551936 RepID=UPI000240988A|nr:sensor histidine kinase [Bradyrhizobium sp. STM 3809]CCE01860.1 putative Sensor histidine kinase; HWE histidine kinase family protein [Bradyrhizobium sp. STM 3809]
MVFRGGVRLAGRSGTWPISAYLLILALATSIPITACAAFLAYHFVAESSQYRKVEYEDRLRLMRNATELRVANIIEDLQILALSPLLANGRFAEFRAHAIDAVKLIGGVAIALYDPDGQQLVNTRLDPGTPLPKRTAFAAERRAIETGRPQVSGLQKAVVDGQPIVIIAVPVRIAGEIRYALNIGLSPKYLSTLMDDYVSGELVGSIIDPQGLLLARRPLLGDDDLIGQPTIPAVRSHIGEASAWWIKAVSRSGVATYTSLLRSDQSGWTINLAVPREAIDGPLHRTIEWIVALTVFTFALSMVLARLLGHRFLVEFADLERYVSGLRAGAPAPTLGRISEVNRMKQMLHTVGGELAGALRQQRDLLDEINHRVKNTLGTVQSIARLSRASANDVEHYVAAFEGRILALSEAYNLLTENNWVGADVRAIVDRTLAPYAGPDRLTVRGPSLLLPPKLTLALSAAIQELSTNAAKYGAFSTPSGKLDIAWTGLDSGIVRLVWIERDGPLVRKPTRRGFGTRMITRMFGAETGWAVTLDFDPGGLRCTMQFGVQAEGAGEARLTG